VWWAVSNGAERYRDGHSPLPKPTAADAWKNRRPPQHERLPLACSTPAEAERARRSLRQAVVLPRVGSGLNLRHGLARCGVHVVQSTRSTGRVRVVQSSGFVGVVNANRIVRPRAARDARRSLHLAGESAGRSGRRERHRTDRGHKCALHLPTSPVDSASAEEATVFTKKREVQRALGRPSARD
jgi:hypothetical protein